MFLPYTMYPGPGLFMVAHAVISGVEYKGAGGGKSDAKPGRCNLTDKNHNLRVLLESGYLVCTVFGFAAYCGIFNMLLVQQFFYGSNLGSEAGNDY